MEMEKEGENENIYNYKGEKYPLSKNQISNILSNNILYIFHTFLPKGLQRNTFVTFVLKNFFLKIKFDGNRQIFLFTFVDKNMI